MKYCGKCGSALDSNTGFCPKCGKKQMNSNIKQFNKKIIIIPIAIVLIFSIAFSVMFATGVFNGSKNAISEDDAQKMIDLIKEIGNLADNKKGQKEIKEYLNNLDWVEKVTETEDGGLTCRAKFGVTGVWTPKKVDVIGSSITDSKRADIKNMSNEKIDSHIVRSIALLCPYASTDSNFLIDYYSFLGDVMTEYANSTFTVFKDSEVNLELLKNLNQYDMVWFYSHGALSNINNSAWAIGDSDPYTMTGEFANSTTEYILLSDDFFTGRTIVSLDDGRIGVGGNFYKHYYSDEQLKNTFFHFASCNSMRTDKLADGLLSRGAVWVEGWSESVNFSNDYGQFMGVLESLLKQNTIQQAISYADATIKDKYPNIYQNDCKLKGKGNEQYKLDNLKKAEFDMEEELNKAFSGSVSGKVVSSSNNSPLPDVDITVLKKPDSKEIATSFTDKNGNFSINLSTGEYDFQFSKKGYKTKTSSIKVDRKVMTIIKDNFVLQPKDNGFVNDKYLVEFNEVLYGVDKYGLWKNEGGNTKDYLVNCSAANIATDGQTIYYSVRNENPGDSQYQYDMYKYDLETKKDEKITSYVECGVPICVEGETIYYTDYSENYKSQTLAHSLCSYNTSTGEKKYIHDGAQLVKSCDGKIFYRDALGTVPSANSKQKWGQISCYDTTSKKTEMISDGGVMNFKVISGKLYYSILYSDQSNTIKVCRYDVSSGKTDVLFEKVGKDLEIQDYDDRYAIYTSGYSDSTAFYRVSLSSGKEEKISSSSMDGYLPHKAIRDKNRTVLYTDYSGGNVYTIDDSGTKIDSSTGSYKWDTLLAIHGETAFAVACENKDFTGEHSGETMFVDPAGSSESSSYYEYYICCGRVS